MGNTNIAEYGLEKGEGFRILKISEKSPFIGKVEEFFDFIIQIIPPESSKSPAQILDKLAPHPESSQFKSPIQILNQNAGKVMKVKIVSTKYRKVRTIEVNLVNPQAQNSDITGLTLRKERYDEVFDTYFPITDIQNNSPVKKAGIRQGQYLIGCLEYPYQTIDSFMEGLYERFFNKELKQKNVHLVLYDIVTDNLTMKEVTLKRGWGGKGILGCQFLQGLLNKFPHNLQEQRRQLRQKENQRKQIDKLRYELGDCDGASKSLIEALESQKNKKSKHLKNLKNILNIEPPNLSSLNRPKQQLKSEKKQLNEEKPESMGDCKEIKRIEDLEKRVSFLQGTLLAIKQYLSKLSQQEECQLQKQ